MRARIFTISMRKIGSKGVGFIIRDGSGLLYVGCNVYILDIFSFWTSQSSCFYYILTSFWKLVFCTWALKYSKIAIAYTKNVNFIIMKTISLYYVRMLSVHEIIIIIITCFNVTHIFHSHLTIIQLYKCISNDFLKML
jgi:hypothetical protein